MSNNITYPQYRKYNHSRTYFKITSADSWEELHVMGSKVSIHQFKATILPDRNYLYDLTFDYMSNWVKIEGAEYESIRNKAS